MEQFPHCAEVIGWESFSPYRQIQCTSKPVIGSRFCSDHGKPSQQDAHITPARITSRGYNHMAADKALLDHFNEWAARNSIHQYGQVLAVEVDAVGVVTLTVSGPVVTYQRRIEVDSIPPIPAQYAY